MSSKDGSNGGAWCSSYSGAGGGYTGGGAISSSRSGAAGGYTSGGVVSASGGMGSSYGGGGGGYASGGATGYSRAAAGLPGFAGAGTQDFDLAIGCVRGVRCWSLKSPDFSRDPLTADEHWQTDFLRGVTEYAWTPGVNEAVCRHEPILHKPPVEVDETTEAPCGCGFWAYWEPQMYDMGSYQRVLPVLGVIEGTGRTLIGPKGFRSQKARIVALHLPFRIQPEYNALAMPPSAEPPLPKQDWVDAWMAVIETRLETMYPGVKMYSTLDAMRAAYPVDMEHRPPVGWDQRAGNDG